MKREMGLLPIHPEEIEAASKLKDLKKQNQKNNKKDLKGGRHACMHVCVHACMHACMCVFIYKEA